MLLWRSRFLQGVSFTNINNVWPNLSRIIDVLTSERNTVCGGLCISKGIDWYHVTYSWMTGCWYRIWTLCTLHLVWLSKGSGGVPLWGLSSSCVRRKPRAPPCTGTLSTAHTEHSLSSCCSQTIKHIKTAPEDHGGPGDIAYSSIMGQPTRWKTLTFKYHTLFHRGLTSEPSKSTHLLSTIHPSTLCSSLPKSPHGLKFKQHFSPVLFKSRKPFHSFTLIVLCHAKHSCSAFYCSWVTSSMYRLSLVCFWNKLEPFS